ncbi:MAG TPA: hypothetical protein VH351_07690 [Bryobacteraceae bacterium]|jgi:FtsZ-binding cell division protein ZapB|nr:hypothetical protein [Bryobacteraceae bacterium]
MEDTPFTTIESAEEFLQLLYVETGKVYDEIETLLQEDGTLPRREEALRLVVHKLNQLQANTQSSLRVLRDLRSLRTLLLK